MEQVISSKIYITFESCHQEIGESDAHLEDIFKHVFMLNVLMVVFDIGTCNGEKGWRKRLTND